MTRLDGQRTRDMPRWDRVYAFVFVGFQSMIQANIATHDRVSRRLVQDGVMDVDDALCDNNDETYHIRRALRDGQLFLCPHSNRSYVYADADEKTLRRRVVKVIFEYKRWRMGTLLDTIYERRNAMLKGLFSIHLRHQDGLAWLHFPLFWDVQGAKKTHATLLLPQSLTTHDELAVWSAWNTATLPAIKAWIHDRRSELEQRVPADMRTRDSKFVPVFICGNKMFVGIAEAAAHRHRNRWTYVNNNSSGIRQPCPSYDIHASSMLVKLFEMLDVPDTASLDSIDPRFELHDCPPHNQDSRAMDWRQCVRAKAF
jgi:hypothetical protein